MYFINWYIDGAIFRFESNTETISYLVTIFTIKVFYCKSFSRKSFPIDTCVGLAKTEPSFVLLCCIFEYYIKAKMLYFRRNCSSDLRQSSSEKKMQLAYWSGPIVYLWVMKVLVYEERHYKYNASSHWLRPCPAMYGKLVRVYRPWIVFVVFSQTRRARFQPMRGVVIYVAFSSLAETFFVLSKT